MARLVWVATVILHLGVTAWGWSVLPENGVVVKTGLGGEVERYGTRAEYVQLNVGLLVFVTVLVGLVYVAVHRGHLALLNLPNKEYWFAPERRRASLRVLGREALWLLAGTNVLFASIAYDLTRLTLHEPALFGALTIVYLALVLLWGWRLDRRFRRLEG